LKQGSKETVEMRDVFTIARSFNHNQLKQRANDCFRCVPQSVLLEDCVFKFFEGVKGFGSQREPLTDFALQVRSNFEQRSFRVNVFTVSFEVNLHGVKKGV